MRDVTAVLDAEGIDRAHYWGYSMGGAVGFGVGIFAPERVRALILGGTSPYRSGRPDDTAVAAELRRGTMEEFVATMEARTGAPLPPEARAGRLANDPLALAASADARAADPDLGERVAEITAPTLLYAGDQDPPYAGAQRAAILPHVRAFLARVG